MCPLLSGSTASRGASDLTSSVLLVVVRLDLAVGTVFLLLAMLLTSAGGALFLSPRLPADPHRSLLPLLLVSLTRHASSYLFSEPREGCEDRITESFRIQSGPKIQISHLQ